MLGRFYWTCRKGVDGFEGVHEGNSFDEKNLENCSGENRTKIDFELIGRKDRKHLKDVKAIRDIGTFVACTHSSDLNERKLKNKDVQSNFE